VIGFPLTVRPLPFFAIVTPPAPIAGTSLASASHGSPTPSVRSREQ
jgi:hypothetical protein